MDTNRTQDSPEIKSAVPKRSPWKSFFGFLKRNWVFIVAGVVIAFVFWAVLTF